MSVNGVVDWFSGRKGFGFIKLLDNDERVFCHRTNISCDGYKNLYPGEYVSLVVEKGDDDRTIATNVTGLNGGDLLCQNKNYTFKVIRRKSSTSQEESEEVVSEN